VTEVAKKIISPTQKTFLQGRNKMEEVIVLHETIHECIGRNKMVLFRKLISKKHMSKLIGLLYNRP
jgi:hypothetical protein